MNKLTLTEMAKRVLSASEVADKIKLSEEYSETWLKDRKVGNSISIGKVKCPNFPSRPRKPNLLPPRQMPKRKYGTKIGRVALLHSVAHIELNAIDQQFLLYILFHGHLGIDSPQHLHLPFL